MLYTNNIYSFMQILFHAPWNFPIHSYNKHLLLHACTHVYTYSSYVGWLVQCYCSLLSWHAIRPCPSNLNLLKSNNIFGHRHTHAHTGKHMYVHTHTYICTQTHTHTHISDRPIMLIFYVPIMLCCSAHKIYLLCTILC